MARHLAAGGLVLLTACAAPPFGAGLSAYQRTADSWAGAPAARLQDAWGAADGTRNLAGGARQLIYSRSEIVAGIEAGCEARFTVSPSGTITAARVAGTVGACRRLLANAPARER